MSPALPQSADDLDVFFGKGFAKPSGVTIDIERPLTQEDIEVIENRTLPLDSQQSIRRIGHQHHRLAQLIVKGEPLTAIASITGYSPQYIKIIQKDPTFAELIEHYKANREAAFVDLMERMKVLGIMALEELQQRLSDDPEGWTKRELMDLQQAMAKAQPSGAGGPSLVPPIQVTFVQAGAPQSILINGSINDQNDIQE